METLIVDTSCLLAVADRADHAHHACVEVLGRDDVTFVVSPYVVAELDYLVAVRFGIDAELKVLRFLSGGRFRLATFEANDIAAAATVIAKYPKLQIGLADASTVVLAQRHSTKLVATLDRRHFDVVRPLQGGRFALAPDWPG